jgi:hypothetical protein
MIPQKTGRREGFEARMQLEMPADISSRLLV